MSEEKILCVGCKRIFDRGDFEQHEALCREESRERLEWLQETRSRRASVNVEGPVNINTATLEELQSLPAIGAVMAERIIAARPFESPEDLLRVEGLGHHIWAQLQDYIVV